MDLSPAPMGRLCGQTINLVLALFHIRYSDFCAVPTNVPCGVDIIRPHRETPRRGGASASRLTLGAPVYILTWGFPCRFPRHAEPRRTFRMADPLTVR